MLSLCQVSATSCNFITKYLYATFTTAVFFQLWDIRKKAAVQTFQNTYQVLAVTFNDTSDQIISGGIDNDIKVGCLCPRVPFRLRTPFPSHYILHSSRTKVEACWLILQSQEPRRPAVSDLAVDRGPINSSVSCSSAVWHVTAWAALAFLARRSSTAVTCWC